jgi:hypothetical protein
MYMMLWPTHPSRLHVRLWLTHPCRLEEVMDIRIKYTRFVGTRTAFNIGIMEEWHHNTISNGYLLKTYVVFVLKTVMDELWRTDLEMNNDKYQKKYRKYLSPHSDDKWKPGSKYTKWIISK